MKPTFYSCALRRATLMTLAVTLLGSAFFAQAQVGPSPAEAAALTGLHAAAHRGNTAQIEKLAAAKADPNAKAGNGRTPVDRKSTRLNSSHSIASRMPSCA